MTPSPYHRVRSILGRPLRPRLGRRTWMLIGLAVIAIALYWQQSWLTALGVAPFLIALLPCMAMCALGLCMHGKPGKKCSNSTEIDDRSGSTSEPRG